ncbi:MAG: hypothetical protein AAGA56_01060, partial [Myxococcota bacterium]
MAQTSLARDADREADLANCRFEPGPDARIGDRCGDDDIDLASHLRRLEAAIDPLTEAGQLHHLRAVARRGAERGRRRGVVGVVGDSISASPKFFRPFARPRPSTVVDPAVARRLAGGGAGMIDRLRETSAGPGLNSFSAPRAAKVGAPAPWALPGGIDPRGTPVGQLVARTSPQVALVMFGSNDA